MERSEKLNEFAAAFVLAQSEFTSALKAKTADASRAGGGGFKFDYADLEMVDAACKPALNKHGIGVHHFPSTTPEGVVNVLTMLMHGKSEQWIACSLGMKPSMNTPQAIGSTITYCRRYGLASICGVVTSDDDGAEASKPAPGDAARSRSVPKQPPAAAPQGPSKDDLLVMVSDWLEVAREDAIGEIKKLASHIGLKTPLQNGDVSKVVELVTALKAKGVNRDTLADALKAD
jgi:hypothetical protein